MYRLLADVLNDLGFALDCLSPAFPKSIRVIILSFSSVLRALCGVAAGSAKASLSAHFARRGNLAELNAKDSSQETMISLFGMLAGSFVVSWVTTPVATWTTLILLLSIHLETNRRAVRAVSMRTLSRQRATLVYHQLQKGRVPTPDEIAGQEHIFETDGILRAASNGILGYCTIGSAFSDLLKGTAVECPTAFSYRTQENSLADTFSVYKSSGYILWAVPNSRPLQIKIAIKQDAVTTELLTAWWQALILASNGDRKEVTKLQSNENNLPQLQQSMDKARSMLSDHQAGLRAAGWDLDINALETTSSPRFVAEM